MEADMPLTTANATASQLADMLADSMKPATNPAANPVLGRSKLTAEVLRQRGECRRRIEAIHDDRELNKQLEL
jgi:hypothetical protein